MDRDSPKKNTLHRAGYNKMKLTGMEKKAANEAAEIKAEIKAEETGSVKEPGTPSATERASKRDTVHDRKYNPDAGEKFAKSMEKNPRAPAERKAKQTEKAADTGKKLTFEEGAKVKAPSKLKHVAVTAPALAASAKLHQETAKYEDDNVGIEAAHKSEAAAEGVVHGVSHSRYAHKLKEAKGAEKAEEAAAKTAHTAQKEAVKKVYAEQARQAAKGAEQGAKGAAKGAEETAKGVKRIAEEAGKAVKSLGEKLGTLAVKHWPVVLAGGAVMLVFTVLAGSVTSFTTMFSGSGGGIIGTSYTAEDDEIYGTEEDYTALEQRLRADIRNVRTTHPGYDEYQFDLDEIGHNPYELAAYLTILHEAYERYGRGVQLTLTETFEAQYELTFTEEIETRTRTETRTGTRQVYNPDTDSYEDEEYEYEVEVEYEYKILTTHLRNHTMTAVIEDAGIDPDMMERYSVMLELKGNRPYLFQNDVYANPVVAEDIEEYTIPGEALTDAQFARMVQEAEKYLGYPYVWGGSNPSTSFDCSGFVCYVLNNCGNGWDVGRTTANGLRNYCDNVPASEAKPGDLIFFKGTYGNGTGATHVGIYVGGGMMLHCGSPIQYTSINSSYWQSHFLGYGRMP